MRHLIASFEIYDAKTTLIYQLAKATMDLNTHISEFKHYLILDRGLNIKTVNAYLSDIEQFFIFFKKRELTPKMVTLFSQYLFEREFSALSISRKLSSVKKR